MNKFFSGNTFTLVSVLLFCAICEFPDSVSAQLQSNANSQVVVPQQTGPVQTNGASSVQPGQTGQPRRNNRRRGDQAEGPPTLGLDQGFMEFDTPDFNLKLVKVSQTVAALKARDAGGFDFTPGDQLQKRAGNHYFQLGDLTIAPARKWRWRVARLLDRCRTPAGQCPARLRAIRSPRPTSHRPCRRIVRCG